MGDHGNLQTEPLGGGEAEVALSGTVPEGWDVLVGDDPSADFFHTPNWTVAICTHLPHLEPVWLTINEGGKLAAGLVAVRCRSTFRLGPLPVCIDRLESSHQGTSGGPLISNRLSIARQARLFSQLVTAYRELRGSGLADCHLSLNPQHEVRFGGLMQTAAGWRQRPLNSAILDLSGGAEEVATRRMAKSKRNERNRALRRGAEVFATNEESLLDAYYPLYESACRHWGKPALPLELLAELLNDSQGRVFMTCVRLAGQVIGGHINCHHGQGVVAWNGVTDPAFANTHFPATLAIWGDIEESCRRGANWLDLGSSGGIGSLTNFKKLCGAKDRMRGWYVHETPLIRGAHWVKRHYRRCRELTGSGVSRLHDGNSAGP